MAPSITVCPWVPNPASQKAGKGRRLHALIILIWADTSSCRKEPNKRTFHNGSKREKGKNTNTAGFWPTWYRQWQTLRSWGGNSAEEVIMAWKNFSVIWRRLRWLSSRLSLDSSLQDRHTDCSKGLGLYHQWQGTRRHSRSTETLFLWIVIFILSYSPNYTLICPSLWMEGPGHWME